jgi:alpha/beta superfamily hydrolase
MTSEPVEFSAEDVRLEGLLETPGGSVTPAPAVVLCHPHPLRGGNMHNDAVVAVARALVVRGIAVLRFNFRGTGRSTGEHAGGVGEREDAWAALDFLRGLPAIDRARLGLAGYSFGAGVALNAGIAAGVRALAAISLPVRTIDFTAMQGYEIPVLLISGDSDDISPAERIEQLPPALGAAARCSIIRGADHFWGSHIRELTDAVGAFFADALLTDTGS